MARLFISASDDTRELYLVLNDAEHTCLYYRVIQLVGEQYDNLLHSEALPSCNELDIGRGLPRLISRLLERGLPSFKSHRIDQQPVE